MYRPTVQESHSEYLCCWISYWQCNTPHEGENSFSDLTYLAKVDGSAQHLGIDPFPDLVGHFGAPWWPFWVLRRCGVAGPRRRQAGISWIFNTKFCMTFLSSNCSDSIFEQEKCFFLMDQKSIGNLISEIHRQNVYSAGKTIAVKGAMTPELIGATCWPCVPPPLPTPCTFQTLHLNPKLFIPLQV